MERDIQSLLDNDEVDLEIVWSTVINSLPTLIEELEKVVPPKT